MVYQYKEVLTKHIRKLSGTLKEEKELIPILKRRLTKKEFRLLNAMAEKKEDSDITVALRLDRDSLQSRRETLIKKINQEKMKQELTL